MLLQSAADLRESLSTGIVARQP